MAVQEVFGNRRIAIFMSDSFLRTGSARPPIDNYTDDTSAS